MRGKTRLLEDRGGPEHSSAGRPAGNTRNKLQSVIQAEGEPSFPKMLMSAHLEGSGVQIPGEARCGCRAAVWASQNHHGGTQTFPHLALKYSSLLLPVSGEMWASQLSQNWKRCGKQGEVS